MNQTTTTKTTKQKIDWYNDISSQWRVYWTGRLSPLTHCTVTKCPIIKCVPIASISSPSYILMIGFDMEWLQWYRRNQHNNKKYNYKTSKWKTCGFQFSYLPLSRGFPCSRFLSLFVSLLHTRFFFVCTRFCNNYHRIGNKLTAFLNISLRWQKFHL